MILSLVSLVLSYYGLKVVSNVVITAPYAAYNDTTGEVISYHNDLDAAKGAAMAYCFARAGQGVSTSYGEVA